MRYFRVMSETEWATVSRSRVITRSSGDWAPYQPDEVVFLWGRLASMKRVLECAEDLQQKVKCPAVLVTFDMSHAVEEDKSGWGSEGAVVYRGDLLESATRGGFKLACTFPYSSDE